MHDDWMYEHDSPMLLVDAEHFWMLMVLACAAIEAKNLEDEKWIATHGRHVLLQQAPDWLAKRESEPCPKVGLFPED